MILMLHRVGSKNSVFGLIQIRDFGQILGGKTYSFEQTEPGSFLSQMEHLADITAMAVVLVRSQIQGHLWLYGCLFFGTQGFTLPVVVLDPAGVIWGPRFIGEIHVST